MKNRLILYSLFIPLFLIFGIGRVFAVQDSTELSSKDTLYITLSNAFDILLENNLEIKAANYNMLAKRQERRAAKSHHLPNIGLLGNYTLLDKDIKLEADLSQYKGSLTTVADKYLPYLTPDISVPLRQAVADLPSQLSYTIQERQFGFVAATVTWPLFTGGLITAAGKAAEAYEERSAGKYRQIQDEQITELIQRYYGLQMATQLVKVRQEVRAGIGKHLSDAKKMEENGMISRAQRLYADVAWAEANTNLIIASHERNVVVSALQNTLSTEANVIPISAFFFPTRIPSIDVLQNYALDFNPQLNQVGSLKKLVDQKIRKEKSAYFPDVVFMGTGNIWEDDLSDHVPDWFIGVGVTFDIFDGFARDYKIRAAKLQKEEIVALEDNARNDIKTVVIKTYTELLKAEATYRSLDVSLEFAVEYLRVQERSFAEGFATTTDVIDANLNLAKVKIERLKAVYEYDIAFAILLQYCGRSEDYLNYFQDAKSIEY